MHDDQDKKTTELQAEESPSPTAERIDPPKAPEPPTPLSTRILAGLGALFVILVTLAFAYSISTGDVFLW